jgi:hypothetical protein
MANEVMSFFGATQVATKQFDEIKIPSATACSARASLARSKITNVSVANTNA